MPVFDRNDCALHCNGLCHGRYDQIVYVAPRKNVVIVRLGDALDENVPWPLVIQDIVDKFE